MDVGWGGRKGEDCDVVMSFNAKVAFSGVSGGFNEDKVETFNEVLLISCRRVS